MSHTHEHEHGELTDANREAWDAHAKTYDTKPWQQKISSQISEALRSRAAWIGADWSSDSKEGKECRLLDYACGTGSVTRALSPYITHATGLDISPQMLQQYTSLLTTSHPSLPILTAVADLVSPTPAPGIAGPEFHNYDIAAIALGFHHFGDPKGCVQRLVQRLKQGGVLLVVDWLPSEYPNGGDKDTEEWQRMKKTIKHNGFTEEDMRGIFEGAGLVDFGFVVLGEEFELQMNGKEVKKTGFIAKGRKA